MQLNKLKEWTGFVKDFNETYELQNKEMLLLKEEIFNERIAITNMKSH